ncbi:Glycine amidinotransferase, mitochondrial precursor (L-arginine:glycine amidinotransferase) (Transamidinase) (AT) [Xenorhabdus nematophila ATCC 19061]|uniref:Glycine amidinotransferase, mitochondrial (L-arginine:glycine amidinotransferase) (Transamidinase) (AT) n=1 Tax=Xenorhabdus nematophila (strain ATCC 19061 / DSM 3370 / CCUG 14189 / LMG 1036 / NCIMB 9965 / AN6) TaxID=406817 RepID=D3VFI1_XENNA|nr:amidinotransferase [Xenorhabdus nematophila]CBJ90295.1 Glycine amidinotransferase, mitochondrial precursor (L-arginine:glycine amidinotransferase) (Transamidinase) (AT) [Xenorhabdus nematophila ATCC 19061]CEK23156.1 Glycine amidinotransferase, mitochondrial precursor (L-arginine:glycine amidinotransferase) (Transamidinase) (AT) [Xenorhabdus nematophila AN6/1]
MTDLYYSTSTHYPVNAFTEWDPLEEVIVGIVEGARFPSWHMAIEPVLPDNQIVNFQRNAERSFPQERIDAASKELEEFVHILESEGVKVRRPDIQDQTQVFGAPGWKSTGLYCAMPRDVLLVIGDNIIECPLAWRSRYFETSAYKTLLKEYFKGGAKWNAAPKPQLTDEQYNFNWEKESKEQNKVSLAITEFEPTFDAADFYRCGRDIIAQKSHVTNDFGIEWLRRHLGDDYRIHVFEFDDPHPMHIDATFVPISPGKLLINPDKVSRIPELFKNWDVLHAPKPIIPDEHPLYMTSKWINMNILMLDENRIIVEKQDEPMITAMKRWGFTPIPCNFRNFNSFGGSFHCATLDVRRRGSLQSYF